MEIPGCHYGEIGHYMSHREPMLPEYEERLENNLKTMHGKVVRKLGRATNEAKKRNYRRHLWVLDGFLDHKLFLSKLLHVSKVYKRIDLVPEGYQYPTFYEL